MNKTLEIINCFHTDIQKKELRHYMRERFNLGDVTISHIMNNSRKLTLDEGISIILDFNLGHRFLDSNIETKNRIDKIEHVGKTIGNVIGILDTCKEQLEDLCR